MHLSLRDRSPAAADKWLAKGRRGRWNMFVFVSQRVKRMSTDICSDADWNWRNNTGWPRRALLSKALRRSSITAHTQTNRTNSFYTRLTVSLQRCCLCLFNINMRPQRMSPFHQNEGVINCLSAFKRSTHRACEASGLLIRFFCGAAICAGGETICRRAGEGKHTRATPFRLLSNKRRIFEHDAPEGVTGTHVAAPDGRQHGKELVSSSRPSCHHQSLPD